ncbi:MAG: folate-binding protein [Gammaproteobacteria bacterium]
MTASPTDDFYQQPESREPPALNLARLNSLGIIRIGGEDAFEFLQGQFTNDVNQVNGAQTQLTGYCNPKGRLIGLMHLMADGGDYLALTDRELIPALIKRLKMFVMRSAVTIEQVGDDWAVAGLWGQQIDPFLASLGQHSSEQPLLAFAHHGFAHPATLLIGPAAELAQLTEAPTPILTDEQHWKWLSITAGQPWLLSDTVDAFLPQMINLDLIDGVSFQKGCYPGQEIVARTRYLGKLKRRMFLFEAASSSVQVGETLHASGEEQNIGTVVNVVGNANAPCRLLAVIRLQAMEGPLVTSSGIELTQLPLPYSITTDDAAEN